MNSQLIQGSPEWLQMRKQFLGASDAPVIMGVSPWKTPRQLWEEKLGLGKEETNQAMRYGTEMEEPARRAYERHTGNLVAPAVVFHPEKKFMMASLDGLTLDKTLAVEIKNVRAEDHEKAKNGLVPEKYFPQVQHQLAVLGINMLHYFSFRQGDFALIEVKRNDEYINDLYKNEEKFWDDVQNFREPKLSARDYRMIETPEAFKLAHEYRAASVECKMLAEQLEELEKKEKEFRKKLIEFAGDQNALIGDIKLTKSVRRGTVDYSKIVELNGVDLDKYRKDSIITWRVS